MVSLNLKYIISKIKKTDNLPFRNHIVLNTKKILIYNDSKCTNLFNSISSFNYNQSKNKICRDNLEKIKNSLYEKCREQILNSKKTTSINNIIEKYNNAIINLNEEILDNENSLENFINSLNL